MKLLIAEKPSVAKDIARVLGLQGRQGPSFVGAGWTVTWCVGHLVGLAPPDAYVDNPWNLDVLPLIPDPWRLQPLERGEEQYEFLKALLLDPYITEVINACDAGREGELIFRHVYDLSGSTLPIKRLWIASLTPSAIEEGLRNLGDGADYENLAASARIRNQSDWLLGMNATIGLTKAAERDLPARKIGTLSVGRVQTPTLAMIVKREANIVSFVPRGYFWLRGTFVTPLGDFDAWWTRQVDGKASRELGSVDEANQVVATLRGTPHVSKLERVVKPKRPPALFDLTTLQREANTKLGLSASRTLEVMQALYEKHKLVTYPRTDSRHITPDMVETLPSRLQALRRHPNLGPLLEHVDYDPERLGNRCVDAGKVTDHHAILVTELPARGSLDPEEAAIYELVALRMLAAFAPDASVATTTVNVELAGHTFEARGTQVLEHGWMRIEKKVKEEGEKEPTFPSDLEQDHSVNVVEVAPIEKTTTPPKRYTEATLLSGMERAGSTLSEKELSQALKAAGGIGTPATRASTIETLLAREYIERKGKSLVPTGQGIAVIQALRAFEPLRSPVLTAKWEEALERIALGQLAPERLEQQVQKLTKRLIAHLHDTSFAGVLFGRELEVLGNCPACSGRGVRQSVISHPKLAACADKTCEFKVFRSIAGKTLTDNMLKMLIETGKTNKLKGFVSRKTQKKFDAVVGLARDEQGVLVTKLVFEDRKKRRR